MNLRSDELPTRVAEAMRACCLRLALGLASAVTPAAFAGQTCMEVVAPPDFAEQLIERALSLETWLNGQASRVVLIARKGQDLDKYGVTYSHGAYAVRDGENDSWNVYHNLNTCGTDQSSLYVQGLADFLADALPGIPIAIVVPEPWLADRLRQLLSSKDENWRMHEPRYSAVAYPFATKYQNSDGWLLETFARAASDIKLENREAAQQWLRQSGYEATMLKLSPLVRLGGRMFRANVAFDDHPPELRWNDRIVTHTGDSLLRFTAKFGLTATCDHGKFPQQVCLVR